VEFAVVKGKRESEARRLYLSEELGMTLGLVVHWKGRFRGSDSNESARTAKAEFEAQSN